MTAKEFLIELNNFLDKILLGSVIGDYTMTGKNFINSFGSPGGKWDAKEYPSYEFEKGAKKYLLRLIPKNNKIVIEAYHLKNMLINYLLNKNTFLEENGKITITENFKMTVIHGRSYKDVKSAMEDAGMKTDVILEQNIKAINFNNCINSLLTWAEYRESAKEKLRIKDTSKKENLDTLTIITTGVKKIPLNQILYGPPGTGKTYSTIQKALKIIEPTFDFTQTRENIKASFNDYVESGQIVFTTFHQSMSYEDFIEGIKPVKPDNATTIHYDIIPGIFKNICTRAEKNNLLTITIDNIKQPLTKDLFEEFYITYTDTLPQHTNLSSNITLQTKEGATFELFKNSVGSIVVRAGLKKTNSTTTLNELRAVLFDGKLPMYKSYEHIIIDAILEGKNLIQSNIDNTKENFVLIIDEINRGNVSQIFGELITLIEEDKRRGADEALTIKLPYSKTAFSVPSNLYIIGTMNTADRSVEALDSALRRRFSFEEMPCKSDLVSPQRQIWSLWWKHQNIGWDDESYKIEARALYDFLGLEIDLKERDKIWAQMENEGQEETQIVNFNTLSFTGINLQNILETINKRIEKLSDKDHQIGHSYFMSVGSIEELKVVFANKIIPLLQEYFFGSYDKIGLVLGNGFVMLNENEGEDIFADFETEYTADFAEKPVYTLADVSKMDDESFKAVIRTLLRR